MRVLLLGFFCVFATLVQAQQTINDTIAFGGLQRAYILYVPASYTPGTAAPLVMNFHGYTMTSADQMEYGDFRPNADTAGFLLVHPMGTEDPTGEPYWNVSGSTLPVDDIGFTAALIDHLATQYTVDLDRVYSTGMSNGAYMSYTLACELSERIAAIASVTGTMSSIQLITCDPQHAMPVMDIHGTADLTVPYNGNFLLGSVDAVLNYWVGYNNCDATPTITELPDVDTTDESTAEHQVFQNGNNGVEVEHFKIIDGEHTWPGSSIVVGVTNFDMDASAEIWRFFSQYDINGRIGQVGIGQVNRPDKEVKVYPNPAQDLVTVNWSGSQLRSVRVVNALGAEMIIIDGNDRAAATFSVRDWSRGMYFVEVGNSKDGHAVSKLMVGGLSMDSKR